MGPGCWDMVVGAHYRVADAAELRHHMVEAFFQRVEGALCRLPQDQIFRAVVDHLFCSVLSRVDVRTYILHTYVCTDICAYRVRNV